MAAEQPGAHDHLLCGCMNAVAASQIFESPSSPAALAGPSGTDFTNVGVQEMMKLYYCELRCCHGQLLLCRRARRRRRQLCLLHSSLAHAHLPAAARLFPHQEMYKWLAYGNGELPGCSCPRPLPVLPVLPGLLQQGGLLPCAAAGPYSPVACACTAPTLARWLATRQLFVQTASTPRVTALSSSAASSASP
jgi:hypothetical protein